LSTLRAEADSAIERAEVAEAKNKKYEQQVLEKDQEIVSLQHRLAVTESDLEKAESKLGDAKAAHDENETSKTTNEALTRKIQLLEEELDNAEKNLKDTVERCVIFVPETSWWIVHRCPDGYASRLRQVDLKAEHFERQVQRLEVERDQWEKKCEVRLHSDHLMFINI
jgi:tropomyosin, fungi type